MEARRVVITGLGAVAPNGNNVADFWHAVANGKSGISKITHFDPTDFSSHIGGEIKNFDPTKYISAKELRRMDKFVQFGVVSSHEAMEDSGIDMSKEDPTRVGVYYGSGIGGIEFIEKQHKNYLEKGPSRISPFLIPVMITNIAPGMISIIFGAKGPNFCIVTACASATHSIGEAYRCIKYGDAEIMITGGTEAATTPLGFGGFCSMKALSTRNDDPEKASRPFDKNRDGFVMSEGAAALILEELDHAKKRNAKIYAEVVGYGLTGDAFHITAPAENGEGGARCMKMALDKANINPEQVDYINAHGTSTTLNDKYETHAIKSVFKDHAYKLQVSSTKSTTGHLLGAAGAVELVACAKAIQDKTIPPTMNYETKDPDCDLDVVPNSSREADLNIVMSNSLGFGGHNATLIIKKFTG